MNQKLEILSNKEFTGSEVQSNLKRFNGFGNSNADDQIYYEKGLDCYKNGLLKESENNFLEAIRINPDNFEAHFDLGILYRNSSDFIHAKKYFQKCRNLRPDNFETLFNLAYVEEKLNNRDEAIHYYELCIKNSPKFPQSYYNLGNILKEKRDWVNAQNKYLIAAKLDSNNANFLTNLGITYHYTGNFGKAKEVFKKALSIESEHLNAKINLAATLVELEEYTEALEIYNEILIEYPDDHTVHYNKAMLLFLIGDYTNAQIEYEWRLKGKKYEDQYQNIPFWNNEDLTGRKILVIDEQGIGDLFQFMRYFKPLRSSGAQIIFACREKMIPFIKKLDVSDKIVKLGDYAKADYKVFLMSLHLFFSHYKPSFPYISKDNLDTNRNNLIEKSDKLSVGLVWRGNPDHMYDFKRSISLDLLVPIFQLKNINFYSLQIELTEEEKTTLENNGVNMPDIIPGDFEGTISVINQLDLIISVDTAVVHLAGALNKNVYLMLPKVPDWRWALNNEFTELYHSVSLIKQEKNGDWSSVITRITSLLSQKRNNDKDDVALMKKKIEALELIENNQIEEGINKLIILEKYYPNEFDIKYWLGLQFFNQEDYTKSEEYLLKAFDINRNNKDTNYLLGNIYLKKKDYETAEKIYKDLISENNPGFADLYNNLGISLQKQLKLEEAEKFFIKAINENSKIPGYYLNLANNYYYLQNFQLAIQHFKNALDLKSDLTSALVGKGFVYLCSQNFTEGFKYYAYSLTPGASVMPKGSKKWEGETDPGKTIFIYGEQGFGDVIQFARFLPLLKEMGFIIHFDCLKPLRPLFEYCPYIDSIGELPVKGIDYYSSVLNIPNVLQLNDTLNMKFVPGLFAVDSERIADWQTKISTNKVKVGVAWSTNPKNPTFNNKSVELELFEQLFHNNDFHFYALHKDCSENERQYLENKYDNFTFLGNYDFGETAAIIENLDLIISVDTVLVHLAASLGKKVWTLLPSVPDWRWGFKGNTSYWYPSMELFRQKNAFDWKPVINELQKKLKEVFSYFTSNLTKYDEILTSAKEFLDNGKIPNAIDLLNKNIAKYPENCELLFYLGYSYQLLDKYNESAYYYTKAIALNPEHFNSLNNLGVVLKDLGRKEESKKVLDLAKILNPNNPSVYNNLGITLDLIGEFEKANNNFAKALEIKPDFSDAKLNKANTLQTLGKYDESINVLNDLLEKNPNHILAHFNKSLALLSKGDYTEGFKYYEWRMKRRDYPVRQFTKPKLDTKNIAGKKIFVYDEQGFGDTIQFSRFINSLAELKAEVILQCHNDLADLMIGCNGITKVMKRLSLNEPEVEYDYHIPLLSLPEFFGTTTKNLPREIPYINVDKKIIEKWKIKIPDDDKIKVGIVWEGKKPVFNEHRSCSLDNFRDLFKLKNCTFYSLQKGEAAEREAKKLKEMNVGDLSKAINNFNDTAAIIKNLDLVITIDTSVAHLAGAIGANVWTLLSYKSDWRWKNNRIKSLWYPTMQLIEQEKFGDWEEVFEKVYKSLSKYEKDFIMSNNNNTRS